MKTVATHLEQHQSDCTCEVCFEAPWLTAQAIFLLRKVPPPVARSVIQQLEEAVAQKAAASVFMVERP